MQFYESCANASINCLFIVTNSPHAGTTIFCFVGIEFGVLCFMPECFLAHWATVHINWAANIET